MPIRQGNARAKVLLQQLIAPFILRRSKKEVAPELPALTEETIYCDMTEEQNTCYEQEKNSLRNILLQHPQSTDRLHSFSVLNGILRLRQLSCHPQLILPDYTGTSGKTAQIIETFDTLQSEGHKVLIFSSFVRHLEVLAEAFHERGWKYALLTGSTNNRPHRPLVESCRRIAGDRPRPSYRAGQASNCLPLHYPKQYRRKDSSPTR